MTGGYAPVQNNWEKGGAVLIDGGSASGTFTSCAFIGNIAGDGGALYLESGSATIVD